jgi:hypothetical protein
MTVIRVQLRLAASLLKNVAAPWSTVGFGHPEVLRTFPLSRPGNLVCRGARHRVIRDIRLSIDLDDPEYSFAAEANELV